MTVIEKKPVTLLSAMKISIALVALTISILLSAEMIGLTVNEDQLLIDSRSKLSKSIAVGFSVLIPEEDGEKIQKTINRLVDQNPQILSVGIRLETGYLIFSSVNHDRLWDDYQDYHSSASHVYAPILQSDLLAGNVEIRYEDPPTFTLMGFLKKPIVVTSAYILLIGFFAYLIFILRAQQKLNASAAIIDQVNATFYALSEGAFIVDENGKILLTNRAFNQKTGLSAESLVGQKASELKWQKSSTKDSKIDFPWIEVFKSGDSLNGIQLKMKSANGQVSNFVINASPIVNSNYSARGVLVTLNDVTELELRNIDLEVAIAQLEKSNGRIEKKNDELRHLADRDSLTNCLNRRSYGAQFEVFFHAAKRSGDELCVIMIDIDNFKIVNDTHGHAVGDAVIQLVADILQSNSRQDDLVGRYGGEEFSLALPNQTIETGVRVSERIRHLVRDESISRFKDGPHVTVSIGLASIFDNPQTPDELTNMADEALYVAKSSGRNQVVRWSSRSDMIVVSETGEILQPDAVYDADDTLEISRLKDRILDLEEEASQFSKEIEYTKNYDTLTGLPNQILFRVRIQEAIAYGNRHEKLVAVLVVDINMFSQINNSLGRSIGDLVLKKFANHLNSEFRKSEGISRLTVSRFSADEFAIILSDLNQVEQVTWAVKRLLALLDVPFEIEGHTVYLDSKIGISLYPSDANNVDELFNNAIAAKRYCKNLDTKVNYQFFDKQVQQRSVNQLNLEREIRTAIEEEQWQILYQPKFDIKQGRITGVEALIRWRHPERGLLLPFEFISFAEKRGLIIAIGDWVIKQACQQYKRFFDLGIEDCNIAVNLSGAQLMQPDVVDKIIAALDENEIPPWRFEVEVTETMLMNNLQVAAESLQQLNARGIRIAIDDFGTGYSSLAYLKRFPIDSLKIDQAFVEDICNDDNDKKIVQTVVTMAHSMGMKVIAEGVEKPEQATLLQKYDCDELQGHLISKPLAADELEKVLLSSEPIFDLPAASGGSVTSVA